MPFPSSKPQETNGNGHGSVKPGFVPVMAPPSLVEQEDDVTLGRLVEVLKRRTGVFLGVAALTFGGLTFWHLSRPPAYSGSASLLVEPVTAANNLGLETVTGIPSPSVSRLDYTSQIRVLRGPAVINPILANIQQRYPNITYGVLLSGLAISQEVTPTRTWWPLCSPSWSKGLSTTACKTARATCAGA